MNQKSAVPDAWDDDWESLADRPELTDAPQEDVKTSKAERLARHTALNKKLWDSAESPDTFHFLQARNDVPLKSEFKPAVTVLSRKPTPKLVSRHDPATGMSQLSVDDDDQDDDEAAAKKHTPSPEEQRQKAQREREEKQRRYEEVRERLFGGPASGSGSSTPGNVTPPKSSAAVEARPGRGRGKGRNARESRSQASAESSEARSKKSNGTPPSRQLYDPDYTIKSSSVYFQKRESQTLDSAPPSTLDDVQQPLRMPRGPESTGRGGHGFAPRGKTFS